MNSTTIRSLVWPLPALCLSERQCTRITAAVLISSLPTSGICHNMWKDVGHEPKEERRMDIPNLYIYQETHHTEYYVNQILDNKLIFGKLLRNLSEHTKLELGTGEILFNKDY